MGGRTTDLEPDGGVGRVAVSVDDVARFLDRTLHAKRSPGDQHGVYRASSRPVGRLGLVVQPRTEIASWVRHERLDALFVHRPWRLPERGLGGVGVLAYHLAFDERLTTGYNPRLAEALGMERLETLGTKEGRPIGMLGDVPSESWDTFRRTVAQVFGGADALRAGAAGHTSPHHGLHISAVAVARNRGVGRGVRGLGLAITPGFYWG
jgi:putative NIF3 family GTP cyclohydrolase 1 type 2